MPTEVKINGYRIDELEGEARKYAFDNYRKNDLVDGGYLNDRVTSLVYSTVEDIFGRDAKQVRVEWETNYWWESTVNIHEPIWTAESIQKAAEYAGVTIPKKALLEWSKTDRANWRVGQYLGNVHQPSKCWDEWDDDDCETCEKDRPEMAAAMDDLRSDLEFAIQKAMNSEIRWVLSDAYIIDECNGHGFFYTEDGRLIPS